MVFPYQFKVSLKHKRPMRLKLSLSYGVGWLLEFNLIILWGGWLFFYFYFLTTYGVGWLLELQEELKCEINDPYIEKVKHIVPLFELY